VRIASRVRRASSSMTRAIHTHDEESEWNQVIRRLHESLPSGLTGQLDVSATPRYAKGGLFTWTHLRLPAQTSDHRQRRQAPHEGDDVGSRISRPTSPV